MWAVEQSHPRGCETLIERGADVKANADPDAGGKPRNNLANPKSQRADLDLRGRCERRVRRRRPSGRRSETPAPKKTAAEGLKPSLRKPASIPTC